LSAQPEASFHQWDQVGLGPGFEQTSLVANVAAAVAARRRPKSGNAVAGGHWHSLLLLLSLAGRREIIQAFG